MRLQLDKPKGPGIEITGVKCLIGGSIFAAGGTQMGRLDYQLLMIIPGAAVALVGLAILVWKVINDRNAE